MPVTETVTETETGALLASGVVGCFWDERASLQIQRGQSASLIKSLPWFWLA